MEHLLGIATLSTVFRVWGFRVYRVLGFRGIGVWGF